MSTETDTPSSAEPTNVDLSASDIDAALEKLLALVAEILTETGDKQRPH